MSDQLLDELDSVLPPRIECEVIDRGSEERKAWDAYASHALEAILAASVWCDNFEVRTVEGAHAGAARYADRLLEERRKRFKR